MGHRRPLAGKHGEHQVVHPLAVQPQAFAEVGLLAHPQPPQQGQAGRVARIDRGVDAAPAEHAEALPEHRLQHLAGITPPLVGRRQADAEFGRPAGLVGRADAKVANQLAAIAQADRALEPPSGRGLGLRGDKRVRLADIHRPPALETRDLWMGAAGCTPSVSQGIATVSGQQYALSFWTKVNGALNHVPNQLTVSFNSTTLFSAQMSDTAWQKMVFNVTGTGNDQLYFAANNIYGGTELDDVSLTQVAVTPEPRTTLLLATGLVGGANAGGAAG